MIKTRLRAGTGLRFERQVLVNDDAEVATCEVSEARSEPLDR